MGGCCDIAERPLAMARQVGADAVLRSDPAGENEWLDSADVCIEAAGSPAALGTCLQAARNGGRIVQVGTLPAEGVLFPANSIVARELDDVGAFRAAGPSTGRYSTCARAASMCARCCVRNCR